ncbi:hypothetical protein VdG1_01806 [Verticillium dahliae VDG1]|nr:hypothetical protein VdG1_01806 [Verticillium dahliae VDG1]
MTKELLTVKSKPRGPINYWPYQDVDDVARRAVEKFQVTPFGQIHNCCAHIPYNSGKKDFYEKTGRESFEVFKYEFRVPGVDAEFMVMWDYNIGLVRMTPFFKCCKYGKTVPAKMLSLNPGLKDITHSITGGAILAQGYWMPYNCAKAVCATFCHDIAGALIPLFGPAFPSECIPPGAPEFQRMIISSQIIYDAQREAEITRRTILRALASGHRRRLDQYDSDDTDAGYEGGESQNGSPAPRYIAEKRREENVPGVDPAEKNAALLLMDLSVRDQSFERRAADGECRDEGRVSDTDVDLHRAKRRRAASLPAITSL